MANITETIQSPKKPYSNLILKYSINNASKRPGKTVPLQFSSFCYFLFLFFYNVSFCNFQELVLGPHILSVGVTTPKGQNIKDTVQASHQHGNKNCFFFY